MFAHNSAISKGHTPLLNLMDNSWRTPITGSTSRDFTLNITNESLGFLFFFFQHFYQKSRETPLAANPKSPGTSSRHLSHLWAQISISLSDHCLMFNKQILGPLPGCFLDLRSTPWSYKCLRTCTCITLAYRHSCGFSGHRPEGTSFYFSI